MVRNLCVGTGGSVKGDGDFRDGDLRGGGVRGTVTVARVLEAAPESMIAKVASRVSIDLNTPSFCSWVCSLSAGLICISIRSVGWERKLTVLSHKSCTAHEHNPDTSSPSRRRDFGSCRKST